MPPSSRTGRIGQTAAISDAQARGVDRMGSERLHEDLSPQTEEEKSSERSLGLTFAAVLALIGAVKLYRGNDSGFYWLAAALPFLACAYLWVAPLRPLNLIWHRFGLLLLHVVNPIVMAIVFYATVVPIGFLQRPT